MQIKLCPHYLSLLTDINLDVYRMCIIFEKLKNEKAKVNEKNKENDIDREKSGKGTR